MIPHLEPPPERPSQLDRLVKGIEIPLEYDQCVLAKTVLEGRPFHIRVSESEGGCSERDAKAAAASIH